MAQFELTMPKMGESIAEATITKWLKNEGDTINLDEPLVEIATDKVDSEVPSTHQGILIKKLWNEGDVVAVGAPIAIVGTEAGANAAATSPIPTKVEQPDETIIHASKFAEKALENNVIVLQRKGDVMETFLPKNP